MITIYHRQLKEHNPQALKEFKIGSWIHLEAPSSDELDKIHKQLDLNRDLLEDALDIHEVPRIEKDNGAIYIFTRTPLRQENEVSTLPLLIAIGENFFLTLCLHPISVFDKFKKFEIDFYTTQKTKLLLQIFTEIISEYYGFLNEIARQVRRASTSFEKISNKEIVQFVRFESTLNDFISALVPTNNILHNLLSGKFLPLYERDQDLMEDLSLGAEQLIENCKSNMKTIVNIREAYSTIVTNDLNRVVKMLTALTIIFTIPTTIASFYGMNMHLPLAKNPYAFWMIIGITMAAVAITLFIFSKKRWL